MPNDRKAERKAKQKAAKAKRQAAAAVKAGAVAAKADAGGGDAADTMPAGTCLLIGSYLNARKRFLTSRIRTHSATAWLF